jgi:glycosyltransferase involved in cell wall biosynthesis
MYLACVTEIDALKENYLKKKKREKRAILIKTNLLDRETRAAKEIKALENAGYLVTYICWNRDLKASTSKRLEVGGTHREIQLKLKAPWGNRILLFFPIWWCFVFFRLIVTRWDLAHAGEFTSIPPAVIAGKLRGKPVIYEILDTFEDLVLLPKAIRNICVKIDKLFMWLASSVILADKAQIEEVRGIPNSNVVIIYDSPPDTFGKIGITHRRDDTFTLFLAGFLSSTKALNLDKIFTAVESIEGVKIVIAGHGNMVEEIKEWSHKVPEKIQFIGEITYAEVLERSAKADLLFVFRDYMVKPVNKYICGSKILEAMMCGRPILVNEGTSTANKVLEENCGLVVDANNIEEIKKAIIRLRDTPELCEELGANARKAYEERYSWGIMEKRLLDLYRGLIGVIGQKDKEA